MNGRTPQSRRRGFTLIEVLVAFTILALSLAAVMQAFSTGLTGLRKSQTHVTAVLQARSKLAEVGRAIPLAVGESEGRLADGAAWRLTISRVEDGDDPALEPAADLGLALYDVVIEIERPDEARVALKTRRLNQEPL